MLTVYVITGGEQMRLVNSDTGEVYCLSNGTYGKGSRGGPSCLPSSLYKVQCMQACLHELR